MLFCGRYYTRRTCSHKRNVHKHERSDCRAHLCKIEMLKLLSTPPQSHAKARDEIKLKMCIPVLPCNRYVNLFIEGICSKIIYFLFDKLSQYLLT